MQFSACLTIKPLRFFSFQFPKNTFLFNINYYLLFVLCSFLLFILSNCFVFYIFPRLSFCFLFRLQLSCFAVHRTHLFHFIFNFIFLFYLMQRYGSGISASIVVPKIIAKIFGIGFLLSFGFLCFCDYILSGCSGHFTDTPVFHLSKLAKAFSSPLL